MKALVLAVAAALFICASCVAAAQGLNVATYSTRQVAGAIQEHPWKHLGENDTSSFWYSYYTGDPRSGTGVILKVATKGIGDGYVTIETDSAFVDCSHAKTGHYPSVMWNFVTETDDATTGGPVPGFDDEPAIANVPLQRGTAIAAAVKTVCDVVSADLVNIDLSIQSDGSSTPRLSGSTNLPEGTKLLIDLSGSDSFNRYSKTVSAVVLKGHFETSSFTDNGASLKPASYITEVEVPVSIQSPEVKSYIAKHGNQFTGKAFPPRTIGLASDLVIVEYMSSIDVR